jgi:hypothetical protein
MWSKKALLREGICPQMSLLYLGTASIDSDSSAARGV